MIILTIMSRLVLVGILVGGLSVVSAIIAQAADKEQWK